MSDRGAFALLMLSAFCAAAGQARASDDGQGERVLETQARALLSARCLSCHNADEHKGGLDLSTRERALAGGESGPALVAGEPAESYLLERIEAGEMPPKRALGTDEVAVIKRWIEAGAPYGVEVLTAPRAGLDWWSLQPIVRPDVPGVEDTGWTRNAIDVFVLDRLKEAGLRPQAEADRATLIRRVSLDLTGLPPTPEEVAAFVADEAHDAYERLVDRLLTSPAYGERWGRHWLDAARFAESHGYETNNLRPGAWPYRDWVIRAFNQDLPFSEFVYEQFAGDQVAGGDWLTQAATGFLVGGTHDVVGNLTVEGMRQQRADDLDDMIAATGQAFLGLSAQCARCHDHKFDPISQRDYYALKALFAGVDHAERELPAPDADERRKRREAAQAELAAVELELDRTEPLARHDLGAVGRAAVNTRRNVEHIAPTPAKWIRFTVFATNNGIEPCIDELEAWTADSAPRNVALAGAGATARASSTYPNSEIHRLEHINDGRYGNSRSWISAVAGKGWVEIELADAALIDRVAWGRDREGKFTDRTPTEYVIEFATEPGAWRVVASSADRAPWRAEAMDDADAALSPELRSERAKLRERQTALQTQVDSSGETLRVYAGQFREPEAVRLLRRGDVMQEQDEAAPGVLPAVAPRVAIEAAAGDSQRRAALARWIADPVNPLAARVMVNRVWQHHFGMGLVATSGDFGFNGEKPSHPELLDWLASEYLANGGHLKPIHRLIVTSAAYRQAARATEQGLAMDADNRLVWRFAPRRLEAETIRDAMLASSGALDRRMGGPGYWIWEPNTNYVVVFNPLSDLGAEHARRMVYQYKPRSQHDITFGAFDCPDSAFVTARRNRSTTALQALNMLNSRFVMAQSRALAERIAREAGDDIGGQVRRAFWLVLGRAPSEVEMEGGVRLARDVGAEALCRALFNSSEFLTMP